MSGESSLMRVARSDSEKALDRFSGAPCPRAHWPRVTRGVENFLALLYRIETGLVTKGSSTENSYVHECDYNRK